MALNDNQAIMADTLGDGLAAARDTAREIAPHDSSGDTAILAQDLAGLVTTWQALHESLLGDQVATATGDVTSAAEALHAADTAIQSFRRQATDLSEIVNGLNLGLQVDSGGQSSSLGSLILDLVDRMSQAIIALNDARQKMAQPQPSATAARLARVERTLTRVSTRLAAPATGRLVTDRDRMMARRLRASLVTRRAH